MEGHHYSTKPINVGETIISTQTNGQSFKLVWGIYKQVADELGFYFPEKYGYAYPTDVTRMQFDEPGWNKHTVEAPDDRVTTGNLDYSVLVTMSEHAYADRKIAVLADRLEDRNKRIKLRALRYFCWLDDPEKIELISDCWMIK